MNDFFQNADRIPVTLLLAIAYVTLFALTNIDVAPEDYGETLAAYGLLRPIWVIDGEPWRLLTAAFLHFNLIHIGFNLFGLLALGPALEQQLGSLRYALLYVVAGLGGNIAVCLLYPPVGSVLGGSGALFGMMGAIVAVNMRSGRHLFSFLEFDGPRRMLGLIVINLVIGFLIPIVSNTAHVGGLLAGFLVTFLWLVPGREPGVSVRHWRLATTALFASLLFWCLQPATRWDHSAIAAESSSPEFADELRRAAIIDVLGTTDLTPAQARLLRSGIEERLANARAVR